MDLDLLVGDEEGELLIFLDLSLKFESQVFNGLLQLVNNHLFLAGKINLNDATNQKFHGFVILFENGEIIELKSLFEIIKTYQCMGVNFSTVQNILSLRIDNQLVVLLLKHKTNGMTGRFLFHPQASMNYY